MGPGLCNIPLAAAASVQELAMPIPVHLGCTWGAADLSLPPTRPAAWLQLGGGWAGQSLERNKDGQRALAGTGASLKGQRERPTNSPSGALRRSESPQAASYLPAGRFFPFPTHFGRTCATPDKDPTRPPLLPVHPGQPAPLERQVSPAYPPCSLAVLLGRVGGAVSRAQQRRTTRFGSDRCGNNRATSAAKRGFLVDLVSASNSWWLQPLCKSSPCRCPRTLAARARLERLLSPTRPPCGLARLLGGGRAGMPPELQLRPRTFAGREEGAARREYLLGRDNSGQCALAATGEPKNKSNASDREPFRAAPSPWCRGEAGTFSQVA